MTRINFNRYSGGGYPPSRSGGSGGGSPEADGAQPASLLSRIADTAASLGRHGHPLVATLQVDGVPVMRSGPMNAWAAELGWREGRHMRLFKEHQRAI